MSRKLIPALGVLCLVATLRSAQSDPMPQWGSPGIVYDVAAYNQDVTYLGMKSDDGVTGYGYQWDVTFNGYDPYPDSQTMRVFGVYDAGGASLLTEGVWEPTQPEGWKWKALHHPGQVAEWYTKGNEAIQPGTEVTFTGWFTQKLTKPEQTIIHVQRGPGGESVWITRTPELPPSRLTLLSFGAIGVLRRWSPRRR